MSLPHAKKRGKEKKNKLQTQMKLRKFDAKLKIYTVPLIPINRRKTLAPNWHQELSLYFVCDSEGKHTGRRAVLASAPVSAGIKAVVPMGGACSASVR